MTSLLRELGSIHQINERDLETTSDRLVVAGCTDDFQDAMRIDVNPGIYRARIYYGNVDKILKDAAEGDDSYEIHLWPTNERASLKITKSIQNNYHYQWAQKSSII